MSSRNSYGANLVNCMLTKEQVFKQFRSCYYLLYQCLVPNTREALSLLVQHYSVPKDFKRSILLGENPRVCNQGILNYLLIKLRTDKNFTKFWKVVKTMIKNHVLRRAVEEIQRGIHHPSIVSIQSIMRHHDTTLDTDSVFPLEQRALSMTDNDDDYCVSYIVTMVDVRSCTRSPRLHDQQHISEYPHVSMPLRSPDPITECTDISIQLKSLHPQSSTNVGFKILQSHYSVLVRSMPDDYMNTVSQLERHLTGDHIGSILECRDVFTANQKILDCLIEQINTKEGLLDFCEQFNSITNTPEMTAAIESVKKECIELITATSEATNIITTTTTAITHTTTNTTTATTSSSVSVATPTTVQITSSQNSTVSSESHYSVLVRSMPDDYMNTVSQLERHLTGDHIGSVLECEDAVTANQRILDCLIEQINTKEGLLDFCNWLSIITDTPALTAALKEFKKDIVAAIETDGSNSLAACNFSVQTFIYSNKLPGVVSINSTYELSDVLIDAELSQFGPKGNEIPQLSDLYKDVVPKYAARWKDLGLELKIPQYDLDTIEINNVHYSSHAQKCCKDMLSRWMQITPKPTWNILQKAINGLLLSSHDGNFIRNEILQLSDLYKDVAPKYAARWKDLGIKLKIPQYDLNTIETDNVHHPSHDLQCCKDMLSKWMKITFNPTWNTLQKAIDGLPSLSHHGNSKRIKYLKPQPLPSNHVNRKFLLDEIATKLLQATNDPNKYETTLTITGSGGFGKTTTVISLCYHPTIYEQFKDGFLFIELGPLAPDPIIKLKGIYKLLTDEQCDIDVVEQKINQLTSCNLLVIIDDVWHVEDALPLVKVFSNCKMILTTRMNDIEQYIPSTQSVTIGPMEDNEAVSLLTSGVIDINQLSQEDVNLLHEISQDALLWPLILCLIRGQLSHYLKQYKLPYHEAIQNVKTKLYHKGLTAFDKSNIVSIRKSRNLAVKACIEMTLELLTKPLSDRIKTFILYTGIGISFPAQVLNNLWDIPKEDAEETVDLLWAYGLLQFTNITISPNKIQLHCVEVHAVISQYIIEFMSCEEAFSSLLIIGENGRSVQKRLEEIYSQAFKLHDLSSKTDFLESQLIQIEEYGLPHKIRMINSLSVNDPHTIIRTLQQIKDNIMTLPYVYTKKLLSLCDKEIESLTTDCKRILKSTHIVCRKLNQSIQRNLYEKEYERLIQTVEDFIKNYPICDVAQKAVIMVKKIIPHCSFYHELKQYMMRRCDFFRMMTCEYHWISTITLPEMKINIKLHKQITRSLLNGPSDIEVMLEYFKSGKLKEEMRLVETNRFIKLQKVAPNFLRQHQEQMQEQGLQELSPAAHLLDQIVTDHMHGQLQCNQS